MNLRGLLSQSVTIDFDNVSADVFEIVTGSPKSDAEVVAEVCSLVAAAAPSLSVSTAAIQAALYQDDDAHDTCTLTACLNPLHPGPCKGWKGTLHSVSPGAWHTLEAARVEKANHTRVKKIEALKAQGKPIPHKLLQPIVAKPHPDAGKTANKAGGEAHAAGKAVSDAAGVHVNTPGKVTLGQAVKSMGPVQLGPKGKKPTVASKGIAYVISQPKVTDQYKLDKAAAITPEQWNGLSNEDKATIRDELAKIKRDGFGPQQKKASELLGKLAAEGKTAAPAAPKTVEEHIAANEAQQKAEYEAAKTAKKLIPAKKNMGGPTPAKKVSGPPSGAATAKLGEIIAKHKAAPPVVKEAHEPLAPAAAPEGATSMTALNLVKLIHKQQGGSADIMIGGKKITVGFEGGGHEAKLTFVTGLGAGTGHYVVTTKDGEKYKIGKGEPITVIPKPNTPETPKAPSAPAAAKPKPLPKHVQDAVDMANGHAPGASWSKNHLAAYEKLSPADFHSLPPETQGKIVAELKKGETKFLDPKKIQATKNLLAAFGKGPSTPAVAKASKQVADNVGFSTHLHDHNVTKAQAAGAVKNVSIEHHFIAAKQTAGLTSLENPDSTHHNNDAASAVDQFIDLQTGPYDNGKVLDQPEVKAAVENAAKALHDLKVAQSIHKAKSAAFNKVTKTLANGDMKLSPIEKASLEHYRQHLLNHPVKTDSTTMDKLQADAAKSIDELHVQLQAAKKKASAPSADDMTSAQINSRIGELLGPDALKPNVAVTPDETAEIKNTAKEMADMVGWKYPADALTNPVVAAKKGAFEQAIAKSLTAQKTEEKFAEYLKAHHLKALTSELDINGNTLSTEDHKILGKHAAQLGEQLIPNSEVSQAKKDVDAAKDAFEAAAEHAKDNMAPPPPPEPITLSDFDQKTVSDSYQTAWAHQANKAIMYGLKTYEQSAAMKSHAEYEGLKKDLTDLKVLSGKLALAHAAENTAELNVPVDPDTGLKIKGPELTAWIQAVKDRQSHEQAFADLHKQAQSRLDKIRTDFGLKKRALPKLNTPAVMAEAAESGHYKSAGFGAPNHGKPAAAKNYMLAKVGPKIAVVHKTSQDKAKEKLGATTAKPAASTAAKAGTPLPSVNVGGDDSIAHIPTDLKKTITSDFKGMPKGKYLADPAEDIFDNLVTLAAAHGKGIPDGLSVDQVLKTIDETHSKSLGVANSGMLHKKITEWLGTGAGKKYAEEHSTPDASAVKKLSGELDLPKGVTLEPGQKVQKLAGPGPHDPSLDASAFKKASTVSAQVAQDQYMKDSGIKWNADQKSSLKAYTGSAYHTVNNYLRGNGSADQYSKQAIIDIQSAMMPLQQHTLLKRGSGMDALPAEFHGDPAKMVGKTFQEPGFTSTTVGGEAGHFGGALQLEIEAPIGTPAAFVNSISHYKNKENEMLLAAGTKFKVLSVTKKGYQTVMRVRIVGDK